jgi:DNA invertase Pin-like site-specific DNA recombinase
VSDWRHVGNDLSLGIGQMEREPRRERQAAGIAVAKKARKYRRRKPGTTEARPARPLKLRESGLSAEEIALGASRNTMFVRSWKARAQAGTLECPLPLATRGGEVR